MGLQCQEPLVYPGVVSFDFVKEERRVGMYYFYIADAEFGPGFIKICTYFPYPAKVCALWTFLHNSHYAPPPVMSLSAVNHDPKRQHLSDKKMVENGST